MALHDRMEPDAPAPDLWPALMEALHELEQVELERDRLRSVNERLQACCGCESDEGDW